MLGDGSQVFFGGFFSVLDAFGMQHEDDELLIRITFLAAKIITLLPC